MRENDYQQGEQDLIFGRKEALALPLEDAEYPGGSGMLALVLGFGGE